MLHKTYLMILLLTAADMDNAAAPAPTFPAQLGLLTSLPPKGPSKAAVQHSQPNLSNQPPQHRVSELSVRNAFLHQQQDGLAHEPAAIKILAGPSTVQHATDWLQPQVGVASLSILSIGEVPITSAAAGAADQDDLVLIGEASRLYGETSQYEVQPDEEQDVSQASLAVAEAVATGVTVFKEPEPIIVREAVCVEEEEEERLASCTFSSDSITTTATTASSAPAPKSDPGAAVAVSSDNAVASKKPGSLPGSTGDDLYGIGHSPARDLHASADSSTLCTPRRDRDMPAHKGASPISAAWAAVTQQEEAYKQQRGPNEGATLANLHDPPGSVLMENVPSAMALPITESLTHGSVATGISNAGVSQGAAELAEEVGAAATSWLTADATAGAGEAEGGAAWRPDGQAMQPSVMTAATDKAATSSAAARPEEENADGLAVSPLALASQGDGICVKDLPSTAASLSQAVAQGGAQTLASSSSALRHEEDGSAAAALAHGSLLSTSMPAAEMFMAETASAAFAGNAAASDPAPASASAAAFTAVPAADAASICVSLGMPTPSASSAPCTDAAAGSGLATRTETISSNDDAEGVVLSMHALVADNAPAIASISGRNAHTDAIAAADGDSFAELSAAARRAAAACDAAATDAVTTIDVGVQLDIAEEGNDTVVAAVAGIIDNCILQEAAAPAQTLAQSACVLQRSYSDAPDTTTGVASQAVASQAAACGYFTGALDVDASSSSIGLGLPVSYKPSEPMRCASVPAGALDEGTEPSGGFEV